MAADGGGSEPRPDPAGSRVPAAFRAGHRPRSRTGGAVATARAQRREREYRRRARPVLRPRHPRRRQRRLRRGAARSGARHVGRGDREGQGRRHLPAPRLHPDQGAAARGGGRRRREGRRALRHPRLLRLRRHRGRHRVPHRHRREEVQGPAVPAQGARRHDDRRRGPPDLRRRPCRSATPRSPARTIVLATGSYSRSLPGLELGGRVIDSEKALDLDFVPKKVAVLGGGVIGVEFASVWKSFGADVTIIEALPHLIPNEEEVLSKALERAFRTPRHPVLPRRALPVRHAERLRRRRDARGRQDHRGGAAARRRRPRPVHRGHRLRGGRRHARPRLRRR